MYIIVKSNNPKKCSTLKQTFINLRLRKIFRILLVRLIGFTVGNYNCVNHLVYYNFFQMLSTPYLSHIIAILSTQLWIDSTVDWIVYLDLVTCLGERKLNSNKLYLRY